MRHARLTTLLAAVIFSICRTAASQAANTGPTDHLPSVTDLAQLSFISAGQHSIPDLPYAEVSTARGLFLAYGAGLNAVAKYRDPVLTRGSSGIAIFKAVSPAVVVVVVGNVKNNEFDPEGMGTGAIVDSRGYVLTNWHVVSGHANAVVFLKPANSAEVSNAKASIARVIYQDSGIDLALLKMIDPPPNLNTIAIGEIDRVQVAEDVHVIGHPHGNLWSYSTGVVSQIRDDYKWSYDDGSKHEAKVLQLQTAISPGNSGGPVVDDTGKILGLVAMSEEGQNIDYAIAADVIKRFLLTGMRMTTRGMPTKQLSVSQSPQQLLLGKLSDSAPVTKAVYSDAVIYSINGKQSGLVASFSDGTEIRAWDLDSTGNFKFWTAMLPQGPALTAVASAGSVSHISARP